MDPTSRRRFSLALLAAGSAASALGVWHFRRQSPESKAKKYLRFGQYTRTAEFHTSLYYRAAQLPDKNVLQLDLDSNEWSEIPTTSAPHVIETHPSELRYSLSATQKADTISILDWTTGKQVSDHVLTDGTYFYGHGVFSTDGKSVFTSVFNMNGPSSVKEFRFPDMKLLTSYQLPFGISHEILVLDGNHLLIGISGVSPKNAPGFLVLNLTEKSFHPFYLLDEPHPQLSSIAHIERTSTGFIGTYIEAFSADVRPSGLATLVDGNVSLPLKPRNSSVKTEFLSLAYDPIGKEIWVSIPHSGEVLIFAERDRKVRQRLSTSYWKISNSPLGISHDVARELTYLVTNPSVIVLETKTRSKIRVIEKPRPGYSAHSRLA